VAAARSGARTAFVGAVGDDEGGRSLLRTLADEDVDLSAVATVGSGTGRAIVVVQPSGENTIFVVPGGNHEVTLDDAARRVLSSSRVVLAQLEVPVPVVAEGLRVAREAGALVMLNAAPAAPLDEDVLRMVDLLVVNEHEAATLGGREDPLAAAEVLARQVARTVVTLGAEGAVMVTGDGASERVAALPARPVDTTAAGDTFVGYLAAAAAERLPWTEGLRRSAAAAALTVERPGAVPSIPTLSETVSRQESGSGAR
jgi:ribokinase